MHKLTIWEWLRGVRLYALVSLDSGGVYGVYKRNRGFTDTVSKATIFVRIPQKQADEIRAAGYSTDGLWNWTRHPLTGRIVRAVAA